MVGWGKILVSAPVPLELSLTGFELGLGVWVLGQGLTIPFEACFCSSHFSSLSRDLWKTLKVFRSSQCLQCQIAPRPGRGEILIVQHLPDVFGQSEVSIVNH